MHAGRCIDGFPIQFRNMLLAKVIARPANKCPWINNLRWNLHNDVADIKNGQQSGKLSIIEVEVLLKTPLTSGTDKHRL